MDNPQIPAQPPGIPPPPPVMALPWTANGQYLDPQAFNFLQLLWSAFAGPGGTIDQVTALHAITNVPAYTLDAFDDGVRVNTTNLRGLLFVNGNVTEDSAGYITVDLGTGSGGTVTSVDIDSPGGTITTGGGPITTAGTLTVDIADTAVAPATYGNATNVAQFTVDQQGRLTFAGNVPITFPPDTGITQLTGDVTAGPGSGSQVATLAATGVTAATYGNATTVPQITFDAKGRATAAVGVPITFPQGAVDIEDEGVSVLTADLSVINFTGAGVTAAETAPGVVEVDIPGGGGSGVSYVPLSMGTEPLTFVSDGSGQPILVPYTP